MEVSNLVIIIVVLTPDAVHGSRAPEQRVSGTSVSVQLYIITMKW